MRNLFSQIILLLVLLTGFYSYGQMGNMSSPVGLDRSIGGASRNETPIKNEPVDHIKVMTENLTSKLELDAFQSAVVKNLITAYVKKTEEIALEDIPSDAKREKSNIERTAMEGKFAEIFTEKQKVLFEELKEKNNGKKKKNKKEKEKGTE
jgi:hypothetical protein